jgi:hypothetical protein
MPGLLPDASVKSKWDLTRSEFQVVRDYEIAAGVNVTEEGTVLVREAGPSGTEVVRPSPGAATTEIPLGVALHSYITADTFTATVSRTIPTVAPLTVDVGRTNIVDVGGTIAEALGVASGSGALTTITPGVPASGQMSLVLTTGIATFHADEAGQTVVITFRWNLTVTEAREILRQSHVNRGFSGANGAEHQFNRIQVGVGRCVVYTTMFDAGATWVVDGAGGDVPVLEAGGIFSTNTRNGTGTPFGRVVSVPTVGDPYLGIEYVTP